jgi:sulfur carrier protein
MEVLIMEVNVKLFTGSQEGQYDVSKTKLANHSCVIDVINKYGLPEEEVYICYINGLDADKDQVLQNGDTVFLYPKIGGA